MKGGLVGKQKFHSKCGSMLLAPLIHQVERAKPPISTAAIYIYNSLVVMISMLTPALVVGMLTPAPVQQVGRGERADPGLSQLTRSSSDSIA